MYTEDKATAMTSYFFFKVCNIPVYRLPKE